MAFKFRKLSIRSRRRTLGVAGLALLVEMIASHPRFDLTHVATMARVAGPAMMASLAALTRSGTDTADQGEVAPMLVPAVDEAASSCQRSRRIES